MAHLASGVRHYKCYYMQSFFAKNLMTYPKNINIFPLNGNMHDCILKTCDTCQEMLNSITPNLHYCDKIKHILINQIT